LDGQTVVGGGEGTAEGVVEAVPLEGFEKDLDGFAEPALEKMDVGGVGDATRLTGEEGRKMEPVDGVEKKESADGGVEILTPVAERFEFMGPCKNLSGAGSGEETGKVAVADGGVLRENGV
jgi:hypothetical protein